ncbi:MAG TPA: glutamine amidotransferase [Vicinamibacterales bacterium]|nr:glutamine amidotransferase [Vicinamibacterales bacterium]
MFDALFEALFSYRPVVFQQGEFRFDVTGASLTAGAIVAVIATTAALTYRRTRSEEGRKRDQVILTTLRVVALGLVLFCLFRPTLIVRAAVDQQNVVAVLLDDSRSMQIWDVGGKPRGAFVRDQFEAKDGPIMKSLSDRFLVRTFRFSSTASRLASGSPLTFAGAKTNLGAALDGVRDELAGLPVAAIVLVSDGADTGEQPLDDALLGLKAAKLPVFTVGVGAERLSHDVQIDRVSTPRTVLKDASLLLDVVVRQTGYGGRSVTVDVEDEGRIVGSEKVTLPVDGSPASVRVRAKAGESGPRLFKFRVTPLDDELVTQNNSRDALLDVRDTQERILYFEGEPRWEMKFIRRAVADDKNLEAAVLQRIADNKFKRFFGDDPDDPEELAGGFPKTREELFKYRGLILGSIEAGAFSGDQLQMIADFVDRRGGGLLMLGGARSFGEGGYGGTPVADALPLLIDPRRRASDPSPLVRLKITPTRAGQAHSLTQIAQSEAASLARWAELPLVTSVNEEMPVKPGGTVLLEGIDEAGRKRDVLAWQRYGRGKAIALTLQDTWQWQMHVTMSLEDQTQEHYWRQMLRWLVEGVPNTVEIRMPDRVEPGDPVAIEASVVDGQFVELNDASVVAQIAKPDGTTLSVPLQWTGERDGEYRGTFVSTEPGAYGVTVDATRSGGQAVGSGAAYVRAGPSEAEFFDPTMHTAPLQRIAEETGGRFYTPEGARGLTEDIRYAGRGVTSIEERELWNMPIILIALMGLVCAEWGYRRMVGLA